MPEGLADSLTEDVPRLEYLQTKTDLMDAAVKMESNKHLPDISVGYFNQTIDKIEGFEGWRVGVSFPIWFWSQSGQVQAAKLQREQASNDYLYELKRVETEVSKLRQTANRYRLLLEQYESQTLAQANQIIRDSYTSLQEGEVSFFEYVLSISHAYEIKTNYFELLNKYNQAAVSIDRIISSNH